jgi:hypothetical protein
VDRKAFPPPATARPELDNPYAAPDSPLQEALADIWADVLGLDEVGVRDSFLDLGGNSLAAARIGNRVRQEIGVELDLRTLFGDLTVEGQAQRVLQASIDQADGETLARLLAEAEGPTD